MAATVGKRGIGSAPASHQDLEEQLRACQAQMAAERADALLLQEISAALVQEDNVQALYEKLMDAAMAVMRSDFASMQMLARDPGAAAGQDRLKLLGSRGFSPQVAAGWEWLDAGGPSSCGQALHTGVRAIASNLDTCAFLAGTEGLEAYRQAGIRAAQSTPLLSRSGKLVGMISTHWARPHEPSARDFRLLDILARQAADLLERHQTQQVLQAAARRAGYLVRLADALRPLSDASEIQAQAARVLGEHLGVTRVAYFEVGEADYVVARDYSRGVPSLAGRYPIASFGPGLLAAYRSGQVASATDVRADTALTPQQCAAFEAIQARAYIGVPLVKDGVFMAGLAVHSAQPTAWTDDDIAMAQETAERTWAAVERAQAEAHVRRNQQTFQQLVEGAPFGMYIVDSQLCISHMNADARDNAFGNVRPVIGRPLAEAMAVLWPAAVAGEIVGQFQRVLGTGEPYLSPGLTQPRNDLGTVESYEWQLHRIMLPDASQGVVCYYYDSTKLRQAEQALREADRRKDEFLATLAHELRNPLAPVRNALHALHLAGPEVPRLQWAREVIERQVQQMTRLIDDLLDASRISRGIVQLRREPVELSAVVQSAVETCRPLVEQCGHELTVALPSQPIVLDGDLTRLAQVFCNLLNNASRYTERGGRITLTASMEAGEVLVAVRDTGIGIPPDMLGKVFEPFVQVDRSLEKSQGGLGIGLALVRQLVELHGGRVQARSAGPGQGSELLVWLPAVAHATLAPKPGVAELPAAAGAPRRILVVDDYRDSAESLGAMIGFMRHEVRTAFDGLEALRIAQEFQPHLVLLDIGLPKLNGYDAARAIRSKPWGQDMVLVAVTGWGQEQDHRRSREAGFDRHMVKPVAPEALVELLASLGSRQVAA